MAHQHMSGYLVPYHGLVDLDKEVSSDRTVRPPLFRDRISYSMNMFRPEANRTESHTEYSHLLLCSTVT